MASMAGSKGGISKKFQKRLIKISHKNVRSEHKIIVNPAKGIEEHK